jgi:hypothetical protein
MPAAKHYYESRSKARFRSGLPAFPSRRLGCTPETTTVVEQPTNPTPPWQITVRGPGWLATVKSGMSTNGRGRWLGRHL